MNCTISSNCGRLRGRDPKNLIFLKISQKLSLQSMPDQSHPEEYWSFSSRKMSKKKFSQVQKVHVNNSKHLFLDQTQLFHKVHTSNYHFKAKKVLFLTEKWVYGGFFIGQDFSRNTHFWGLKCRCSVTTSSKNIPKVYLRPLRCLESLVIKQFVELVNSLFGLFSIFWPTV